ncbi:snf7 family protein [Lentinula edodes]|uniref:Snf7 family protein n=1 Tax=Lentinula edodes TaxID=5353 RepID=A0A1Q3EFW5_LENED|nr:snf7 family protein [Lentinula edodes]
MGGNQSVPKITAQDRAILDCNEINWRICSNCIEFSLVEVSVLHGLKQGNEVLKEIHKEMNLESVEKLLEETAEAREYQREIDEMLANNLSLDEEDAVQAELRELQAAVRAETEPSNDVQLPSVPTSEPLAAKPVAPEEQVERDSARVAIPA